jgi:hypothetical protein
MALRNGKPVYLMSVPKKGISANQLRRILGVT